MFPFSLDFSLAPTMFPLPGSISSLSSTSHFMSFASMLLVVQLLLLFGLFIEIADHMLKKPDACGEEEKQVALEFVIEVFSLAAFVLPFRDILVDHRRGTIHHGMASLTGIWLICKPRTVVQNAQRYKIALRDVLHASLCTLIFLSLCFSHAKVTHCLCPKIKENKLDYLPLYAYGISILILLICPSKRRRIVFRTTEMQAVTQGIDEAGEAVMYQAAGEGEGEAVVGVSSEV